MASDSASEKRSDQRRVLVFVCTPVEKEKKETEALVQAELDELRNTLSKAGWEVIVQRQGDARELQKMLQQHMPNVLHFIGHGNEDDPRFVRGPTLCLTDSDGSLVLMDAQTIVSVLTNAVGLELVFLNACQSEPLALEVAKRGFPAVAWRTDATHAAAAQLSAPFYARLASEAGHGSIQPALEGAFQQGVLGILTTPTGDGTRFGARFGLRDQDKDKESGSSMPNNRTAAGVPVLVRRRSWSPATPVPSLPSLPSELIGHPSFTGQQTHLDALRDHFFPVESVAGDALDARQSEAGGSRQAVVQVIRGMGGLGKTQLAIQYALRERGRYPHGVYFVLADTTSELVFLQRMAAAISLPQDVVEEAKADVLRRAVHAALRSPERCGWLLLVDNADDERVYALGGLLAKCLPPIDAPGHVLITSRIGTPTLYTNIGVGAPLQLDVLGHEEAQVLLMRTKAADGPSAHAAKERIAALDAAEREALAWLAGAHGLAGLPLALVMAGAYMREEGSDFSAYRSHFERQRTRVVHELVPPAAEGEAGQAQTTWDISFAVLRQRSEAAAELLALCSLLAPEGIELLLYLPVGEVGDVEAASPALWRELRDMADADERLQHIKKLVHAARRYSLVEWGGGGTTVSMHRLVQDAQRRRLARVPKMAQAAIQLVGELLARRLPDMDEGATMNDMSAAGLVLPHVAALLAAAPPLPAPVQLVPVLMLNKAGRAHRLRGEYARAIELCQQWHRRELDRRGPDHLDTLWAMHCVAIALNEAGRYEEAMGMYRQVLEASRRVLGWEHPDTLGSMDKLGAALHEAGRYEEAAGMYREVLEARRHVLGGEHPNTLHSVNNLANALGDAGRYEEAAGMHREVLKASRLVLGEGHPNTLHSMNNLANALGDAGRYEEAAAMHREVLEVMRRVLGGEHPDTLKSMSNMADAVNGAGRYEEAAGMHREVLETMRCVLGEEHPYTLYSMNGLAEALNGMGQHAEAEVLHRKALEVRQRVLGAEHPQTLHSMYGLAEAVRAGGRLEEAAATHREVLEARRRMLGQEHPDTLKSVSKLEHALHQGKRRCIISWIFP